MSSIFNIYEVNCFTKNKFYFHIKYNLRRYRERICFLFDSKKITLLGLTYSVVGTTAIFEAYEQGQYIITFYLKNHSMSADYQIINVKDEIN